MFNALMDGIADDYLRHVFHVTVKVEQAPEMNMAQASYIAADDPVQEATMAMALATPEEVEQAAALAGGSQLAPGGLAEMGPEAEQKPVVKTAHEKIGRNEPCHCGSGKKFKLCHGAN